MTEAAMDAIPEAVRQALEATSRRYGLYCRRSREAAEDALEIARELFCIKGQLDHGLWMPALQVMKIPYDAASRHMRLVRRGATVEMIQEHGVTGTLMLLSQPRAPAPEKAAGDAEPEDAEFGSSAKFEPPLTVPESAEASAPPDAFEEPLPEGENAGEGDAGAIEAAWQTVRARLRSEFADGEFKDWIEHCRIERREAGAAVIAPTRSISDRVRQEYGDRIRDRWRQELPDVELDYDVAPERGMAQGRLATEPEPEDDPDGTPLWPWPLDMKYSGDRSIRCLIAPEIKPPQARMPAAILAYWNIFGRDGKQRPAAMHNALLAKLCGVDVRTLQDWLADCRRAGWLHSVKQNGNQPDLQYVWPHMPPEMHQRSMPLPRTFDRTHRASALEAAESAAARPDGEPGFTPGVNLASSRGEPGFTPGVTQDSPLNGKETGIKTGRRGTRAGREIPQPDSPHPPEAIQAFGIWNEVAAETGMRPAVELDAERAAKLEARLRAAGGMDEFRAVCERAGKSKALTGRKPGSWPADLDQFLEPRFFRRVREGGWDDAPGELERTLEALRNADPDPEELRAEVLMSPLAGDAPGFVAALCERIGVGWVRSWLMDCRLEWRGDRDAGLIFAGGFMADRADRDYGDAIRDLWRELHGGELVLETRRAA